MYGIAPAGARHSIVPARVILFAAVALTAALLMHVGTARAGTLIENYSTQSVSSHDYMYSQFTGSTGTYYARFTQESGTAVRHCALAGFYLGGYPNEDATPTDDNSCTTSKYARSYCSFPGHPLQMGTGYNDSSSLRSFSLQIYRKTSSSDCVDYHPPSTAGYTFLGTNTLANNASLARGSYLLSSDGRTALMFTKSGNLELYSPTFTLRWQSNTTGRYAQMQPDGNFVVYDDWGTAQWSSSTGGTGAGHLTVQSDGNLVIYNDATNAVTWNTQTVTVGASTLKYVGGLAPNQSISRGQYVLSSDHRYSLHMQLDGNLVLYAPGGKPLWYTGTGSGDHAIMQPDGNFVLYTASNTPVWYSGTFGANNSRLDVQSDGNMVIYNSGNAPIWQTGTNGRL